EMLIQKRSPIKYHSAGLWSNSCCTHPRPEESAEEAAVRRVREELGLGVELRPLFEFVYRAELENGLVEHEYDHVFRGTTDEDPDPNPAEVSDWRWASLDELLNEVRADGSDYSVWFPLILERL